MQNRKSQLKQIVDALGDMAQCGQNHLHGRLNREYPPYRWGRGGAIILHITRKRVGVRRREFITYLAGAAVAGPLSSRAGTSAPVRRIGVLYELRCCPTRQIARPVTAA